MLGTFPEAPEERRLAIGMIEWCYSSPEAVALDPMRVEALRLWAETGTGDELWCVAWELTLLVWKKGYDQHQRIQAAIRDLF